MANAAVAMGSTLPAEATRFVGRESQLAELEHALSQTRLLTLTGPGGTGKTRLALRVARSVQAQSLCPDGAFWVELGEVTSAPAVPEAVMNVIGVEPLPDMSATARLAQHLREQRALIILDNCEQVVGAVAQLAASLLRFAPGVRILATSREALAVAGEVVWAVPPLGLPAAGARLTAEVAGTSEAVSLFVDRAQAADPRFQLDGSNVADVLEICRRLDGIPMAIELAAARVRALSPRQIADRLTDRFRLLAGHGRGVLPRQQTLRALVDWSYDLLSEPERAVWRRLSVFAGGCVLEAAEAVAAGDPVDAADVLDLVSQLVDKSVLTRSVVGETVQYHMLETIRSYGRERLREAGEEEAAERRFLDWHVAAVEKSVARDLAGPTSGGNDDNITWPNVQAAAQAALRLQDQRAAATLAMAVVGLGSSRLSEALAMVRQLIDASKDVESITRAGALIMYGTLVSIQESATSAWRSPLEEGIAMGRRIGNPMLVSAGLNNLGVRLRDSGQLAAAEACFAESQRLNPSAVTLLNLAVARLAVGDVEGWDGLVSESEQAAARDRDNRTASFALMHRATFSVRRRDWAAALSQLDQAAAIFPRTVFDEAAAVSGTRAVVFAMTGSPDAAMREVAQYPEWAGLDNPISATLLAASAMGRHEDVALLAGLLEAPTIVRPDYMQIEPALGVARDAARAALGDWAYARRVSEGRSLRGADRTGAVRDVVARQVGTENRAGASPVLPSGGNPAPERMAVPGGRTDANDAMSVVRELQRLSLSEITVVGAYRRYDERVRHQLRDWHRRMVAPILHPTVVHENFLIWAAPGSGKSFLIQEAARTLGGAAQFYEINLARLPHDEFVGRLAAVRAAAVPTICLLDEVDARAGEAWPYEEAFSLLDLNLDPGRQAVFVLVGSHAGGMPAMVQAMRSRSKGIDMLDRVPMSHRFEIPAPTLGDRLAVVTGQVLEAGRMRGEPVEEIEKLALYYTLKEESLTTPRQLRDLAVAAVQNLPAGERRLKYDDLFYRGDTRSKAFWSANVPAAEELTDRFVRIAE